jgi:hypothetical protein
MKKRSQGQLDEFDPLAAQDLISSLSAFELPSAAFKVTACLRDVIARPNV